VIGAIDATWIFWRISMNPLLLIGYLSILTLIKSWIGLIAAILELSTNINSVQESPLQDYC
jgi:hypothetical protein